MPTNIRTSILTTTILSIVFINSALIPPHPHEPHLTNQTSNTSIPTSPKAPDMILLQAEPGTQTSLSAVQVSHLWLTNIRTAWRAILPQPVSTRAFPDDMIPRAETQLACATWPKRMSCSTQTLSRSCITALQTHLLSAGEYDRYWKVPSYQVFSLRESPTWIARFVTNIDTPGPLATVTNTSHLNDDPGVEIISPMMVSKRTAAAIGNESSILIAGPEPNAPQVRLKLSFQHEKNSIGYTSVIWLVQQYLQTLWDQDPQSFLHPPNDKRATVGPTPYGSYLLLEFYARSQMGFFITLEYLELTLRNLLLYPMTLPVWPAFTAGAYLVLAGREMPTPFLKITMSR